MSDVQTQEQDEFRRQEHAGYGLGKIVVFQLLNSEEVARPVSCQLLCFPVFNRDGDHDPTRTKCCEFPKQNHKNPDFMATSLKKRERASCTTLQICSLKTFWFHEAHVYTAPLSTFIRLYSPCYKLSYMTFKKFCEAS